MRYKQPLSRELAWSRARLSELEAESPSTKLEEANRDQLKKFHVARLQDLAEQLRAQGATVDHVVQNDNEVAQNQPTVAVGQHQNHG